MNIRRAKTQQYKIEENEINKTKILNETKEKEIEIKSLRNCNLRRVATIGQEFKKKKVNYSEGIEKNKIKYEKKKTQNFIRGKNKSYTFSDKNRKLLKVNFEKYMVTVVEVESFKKYNFLNTTKNNSSKNTISCKCSIF